jgi:hypothetical protein
MLVLSKVLFSNTKIHIKASEYFTTNSQNDVNENNKNDVKLIGYRIWMILCDFEMLKK